jgi:phosphopantothenoylcysteine decarboxylase/phosphopantothenate--cysteine ligase
VGENLGFERADNALVLLWPGGREDLGAGDKTRLARRLVARIAERHRAERGA